jgi:hypothetical protein
MTNTTFRPPHCYHDKEIVKYYTLSAGSAEDEQSSIAHLRSEKQSFSKVAQDTSFYGRRLALPRQSRNFQQNISTANLSHEIKGCITTLYSKDEYYVETPAEYFHSQDKSILLEYSSWQPRSQKMFRFDNIRTNFALSFDRDTLESESTSTVSALLINSADTVEVKFAFEHEGDERIYSIKDLFIGSTIGTFDKLEFKTLTSTVIIPHNSVIKINIQFLLKISSATLQVKSVIDSAVLASLHLVSSSGIDQIPNVSVTTNPFSQEVKLANNSSIPITIIDFKLVDVEEKFNIINTDIKSHPILTPKQERIFTIASLKPKVLLGTYAAYVNFTYQYAPPNSGIRTSISNEIATLIGANPASIIYKNIDVGSSKDGQLILNVHNSAAEYVYGKIVPSGTYFNFIFYSETENLTSFGKDAGIYYKYCQCEVTHCTFSQNIERYPQEIIHIYPNSESDSFKKIGLRKNPIITLTVRFKPQMNGKREAFLNLYTAESRSLTTPVPFFSFALIGNPT